MMTIMVVMMTLVRNLGFGILGSGIFLEWSHNDGVDDAVGDGDGDDDDDDDDDGDDG